MSIPTMILGESGTGKSFSLRNLNPKEVLLIQTIKKPLPFKPKGWKSWDQNSKSGSIYKTDDWALIERIMAKAPEYGKKIIIIDDFQYLMANEFMRRSSEKGFEKFNELGHHSWSVMMKAQDLPDDVRVYFLSHTAVDEYGNTKAKTIGKMLDEKITVEGLFTIVLRTKKVDDRYSFSTQNSGTDTVKSPAGLFEETLIENDLNQVDQAICEYYEINQPALQEAS